MSTLKVSAIQNAAAGSGGLVLAADGNVSGAGMDLIVSQSFSAVASVSLNDCFSADYDNYRLLLTVLASAAITTNPTVRLRASGVDNTSSVYQTRLINNYTTTVASEATTSATSWAGWQSSSVGKAIGFADIYGPALADYTVGAGGYVAVPSASVQQGRFGWQHSVQTAFDGLTLTAASGTITGTLRVYGYRN